MGYKPNTPTLPQTNQTLVKSKPNTPNLQHSQVRSRPNTPGLSQYSNKGPTVSPVDPKDHSTPKPSCSSVDARRKVSPESMSAASPSSYDLISNKSIPGTPSVSGNTTMEGKLSRNLSQESLSSSVSVDVKIPSQSYHSKGENGKVVVSPNSQTDTSLNSKTHVANRKRTREGNQNSSAVPSKRSHNTNNSENGAYKGVVNGSMSSVTSDKDMQQLKISPTASDGKVNLPSRRNACLNVSTESKLSDKNMKTPKVKTTAQLIAELQAKSGSSALGSSVIRQIETNQITKESDEMPSALPPGARPRRRRKHSDIPLEPSTPSRPHVNLSQTKTELVEKFLETSITPSTAVDMSPFKYDISKEESPSKDDIVGEVDVTDSSGGDTSFRPPEVGSSEQLYPGDTEVANSATEDAKPKVLTLEELYSQLPPIDYERTSVNDEYELPAVIPVDSERVSELHDQQLEGVNGCFDINGAWRDWTQTLTLASFDADPLHILPYVSVDD